MAKLGNSQQAPESGFCGRCERKYAQGDWVFRDGEGRVIAVNCCATAKDTRPASDPQPLGLGDLLDAEDIEGRDFVPMAQVMPSGKSKADMCPICFQIPAANGLCGC
jgi:hypothetical protein